MFPDETPLFKSMLSLMDKKEIDSPKLTEHFLFWAVGIGVLVIALLFAHFVYHVF